METLLSWQIPGYMNTDHALLTNALYGLLIDVLDVSEDETLFVGWGGVLVEVAVSAMWCTQYPYPMAMLEIDSKCSI